MIMTSEQIRDTIPHRFPFLLIDRVVDGEPGRWAKAIKCVSANEPFFSGHFPNRSIMPGVLIVEAIAQAGAIALLTGDTAQGKLAVLAGVKEARFFKPVIPGDTMVVECKITRQLASIGLAIGTARVGDETVASATMSFAVTDY